MVQDREITGYALPLPEAVALAEREGWRQRVLTYITRAFTEILVFNHVPDDSGVQVPAGGVDAGERPDQTATREAFEETGLALLSPVYLSSYHWTRDGASQVWHYYWFQAPAQTPDAWTHPVTGGANDTGMLFRCRFVCLDSPDLVTGFRYEEALPELKKHLRGEYLSSQPTQLVKETQS